MAIINQPYTLSLFGTVALPDATHPQSSVNHVDVSGSFLLLRQIANPGDFPSSYELWRGETIEGNSNLALDPIGLDPNFVQAHLGFAWAAVGRGHLDRPGYMWARQADKVVAFDYNATTFFQLDPPTDQGIFSGTQFNFKTAHRAGVSVQHIREDSANESFAVTWSGETLHTFSAADAFGFINDVGLTASSGYLLGGNGIISKVDRGDLTVIATLDVSGEAGESNPDSMFVVDDTLLYLLTTIDSGATIKIKAINNFSETVEIGTIAKPSGLVIGNDTSFEYRVIGSQAFFYLHSTGLQNVYILVFNPEFIPLAGPCPVVNRAFVVYHLLTDTKNGLGNIVPSEILDAQSFVDGALDHDALVPTAAGGTETIDKIDVLINESGSGWDLLKTLLFEGRAILVPGAKLSYKVEKARAPSFSFSHPGNVLTSSIQTHKGLERRPNAIRGDFSDDAQNYKAQPVIHLDPAIGSDPEIVENISWISLTRKSNVAREARFRLKKLQIEDRWSLRTPPDADGPTLLDTAFLSYDTPNSRRGFSGFVQGGSRLDLLVLDREIDIAAATQYDIQIFHKATDTIELNSVVATTPPGKHILIEPGVPFASLEAGDLWTIGKHNVHIRKLLVESLELDGEGVREWNGSLYDPLIYDLDEDGFPQLPAPPDINPPIGTFVQSPPPQILAAQAVDASGGVWDLDIVPGFSPLSATAQATDFDSVTLATTEPAIDDFFNGATIVIDGQTRVISDYVGATRVATVSVDFDPIPSVNPYVITFLERAITSGFKVESGPLQTGPWTEIVSGDGTSLQATGQPDPFTGWLRFTPFSFSGQENTQGRHVIQLSAGDVTAPVIPADVLINAFEQTVQINVDINVPVERDAFQVELELRRTTIGGPLISSATIGIIRDDTLTGTQRLNYSENLSGEAFGTVVWARARITDYVGNASAWVDVAAGVTLEEVPEGTFADLKHNELGDLAWVDSGHTGTPDELAGFDGSGNPVNVGVDDFSIRDTRANQPAATAVRAGTFYYVTDESILERSNGTVWESAAEAGGGAGSDTTAIHDDTAGEIAVVTEKVVPIAADLILIEDSAAGNVKKRVQAGNLPTGTVAHADTTGQTPDDHHDQSHGSADHNAASDAEAIHDNVAGEINAITEKATPVSGDLLVIEDSAAANVKKKVQIGNLPTGSDADAIHDNVAAEIAAVAEKVTPVSADLLLIEDSAAANAKKRVQIGNLPGGGGGGAVGDLLDMKFVRKTADETINNSAVQQDDDHLFFAIGANETWEVELILNVVGHINADIKLAFTLPTGASMVAHFMGHVGGIGSGSVESSFRSFRDDSAGSAGLSMGVGNIATRGSLIVLRGVVLNGANAGNVQLQWSQQSATAADTTLKTGSYLIARRFA